MTPLKLSACRRSTPSTSASSLNYIAKLAATKEGDSTLLDNSLLLYGSGMGNPNVHDHTNLPIIVAGGANAGVKATATSATKRPFLWPICI